MTESAALIVVRLKLFLFCILIVTTKPAFAQNLLFKFNTGIPWRSNYTQSIYANGLAHAPGQSPSWIALEARSYVSDWYSQTNISGTNSQGTFFLLDSKGTLRLTVPFESKGWLGPYGVWWSPSPSGSFVLKGMGWFTNPPNSGVVYTNTTFFKFNPSSKTWSTNIILGEPKFVGLTNVSGGGQSGTQMNCALWCDVRNEGGNLVAYVYSY